MIHSLRSAFRSHLRLAAASLAAVSLLAACGSSDTDDTGAEPAATEAMAEQPATTVSMTDESMTDESMADHPETTIAMTDESMADEMADESMSDAIAPAAWQTLQLTDVDGVPFTLDDFHGTPVFVETFATWCPNCKKQLKDTNTAAAQLGDQAVFVALSVETDLSAADVAEYAADNGFDSIRFAVLTPEALAAVVEGLGQSAANPPSTPKVVIDAMGHAGELETGFESVDDIVAEVSGQG
jgi:thiol-disulfide isomerase/thioredoxin